MQEPTLNLIKSGKSIVPSLVDIGLHAHRPFEAMTDEILSINQKFASQVSSSGKLTEYLQKELTKAKKAYKERIQEFL